MNPYENPHPQVANPFSKFNNILQNPFGQMGVQYTTK